MLYAIYIDISAAGGCHPGALLLRFFFHLTTFTLVVGKHNREGGAEKHHARRHHAQRHRVAATFWREQLVYCVCGPARPPQQGRCPRAIGWLIGVRCVPSGRAEMTIEAHGAAAAACATLPTVSSYLRTLPRPCRAPGATLRRRKRLLQRQRGHSADIRPATKIAEQQHYSCIAPAIY